MRKINALLEHRRIAAAAAVVTALAGCGSPPAVLPVMRVVRAAMLEEAGRIAADRERDAAFITRTRIALQQAFDDDLAASDQLTRSWVREATDGYVAAREAVLRHELELQHERAVRLENLRAAAHAQSRAIILLESQNRWLNETLGVDLWRDDPRTLSAPTLETPQ